MFAYTFAKLRTRVVVLCGKPFLCGKVCDTFVNPVVECWRRSYSLLSSKKCSKRSGLFRRSGDLQRLYKAQPIPVAPQSNVWVCVFPLSEIAISNTGRTWISVSCRCCVLSGRSHCVRPITRPEESYRMWCVWAWSRRLDNEGARLTRGCCAWKKIKLNKKQIP